MIKFRAVPAPPYRRSMFTQITPSAIQTGENEAEKHLAKKISLQWVQTWNKNNSETLKPGKNVIFQTHK